MICNSSASELWNLTNNAKPAKSTYNLVITLITMFVSTFGIAGNCLVIWFLFFKIKRNVSTVYILNLAIADTVFLLFVSIVYFVCLIVFKKPAYEVRFGDTYIHKVLNIFSFSILFAYNTSLCLLTVISVERCISVLFPVWYHCKRPQYLPTIVCTMIWLLSCLLTLLEIIFCNKLLRKPHEAICDKDCLPIFIVICCISFMIFIPLMIISSLAILINVCTRSKQWQPTKLYIVITVTVLFFLVFAMPMRVLLLVFYKRNILPAFPIIEISVLFCSLSSSINPFVYYLVGRQGIGSRKLNINVTFHAVFHEEGSQYKKHQGKEIKSNTSIMQN
ncbi:mas-related G-protein coupled receptor member H-like [Bombina bombina]|uniref:mas-related G-protein coupled receptor member H-like n=1 Tax=Bombina bombina TaxID=8345 RepID=UPI00235A4D7E|nr:mas-related G-protein coupled receptor member H-like [Bombina bombina]